MLQINKTLLDLGFNKKINFKLSVYISNLRLLFSWLP